MKKDLASTIINIDYSPHSCYAETKSNHRGAYVIQKLYRISRKPILSQKLFGQESSKRRY